MDTEFDYKTMHISDLYRLAKDQDIGAMQEVIERQQSGRDIRYYPNGRAAPDTDGVVAVHIESEPGSIRISSGRPDKVLSLDRETACRWLKALPRCFSTAVGNESSSVSDLLSRIQRVKDQADSNFFFVVATNAEAKTMSVVFLPTGMKCWRPSPADCAQLVRSIYQLSNSLGWDHDLEPDEMNAVQAMILYANATDGS